MLPLTREDGLSRLRGFLPRAGGYARERNFDHGPEKRENVSLLSPYVRHRLILEEEVVRHVLGRFAYSTVEKFLQEVAWRTYWKGWMEMRPAVWERYVRDLDQIEVDAGAVAAMEGRTGIDCFDAWARELVETGYMHNHARMWFASIWIFTLRLPWQLGADFFLRHLLDGDPAVNTLSWRWVAGVHTKGKHYLARADNIAKYTEGRFAPHGRLVENAKPLDADEDVVRVPLKLPEWARPEGRIGHLMLADDVGPPPCEVDATAGWHPASADLLWPVVSPMVHEARASAVKDTVQRTGGDFLTGFFAEDVREWLKRNKLDAVVLAYPTVGPWRKVVEEGLGDLPCRVFVRDWDRALWPHATAGYFKLREKLPGFFRGMKSGDPQMKLFG